MTVKSGLLDTQYFMFYDKYANIKDGKRETINEAVERVIKILDKKLNEYGHSLTKNEIDWLYNGMVTFDVMPSMRLFSQNEAAIDRDNTLIYNCSYFPIKSIKDIATGLYLSMSGVGIGYSVERENIKHLPIVKSKTDHVTQYTVEDSQAGWADSIVFLLENLYNGNAVEFDYSLIRPKGSLLKTKTGYASGPDPLREYHEHIVRIFNQVKTERQLTTLEVHDIVVKCVECGVSGGGRRGASIAFFDYDDELMLNCKNPENIKGNEHRYNSNNSAVWPNKRQDINFVNRVTGPVWTKGTGEPGIFSIYAVAQTFPARRKFSELIRTNPCGEILLNPYQFCNLTNVKMTENDTKATMLQKLELAAFIGTIQSMFDNFAWIDEEFHNNAVRERLLGVSVSGFYSNVELMEDEAFWRIAKQVVQETNEKYAERFGINPSPANTTVKPSGNSSELANMEAGIHPAFGKFVRRNMMVTKFTDMYAFLQKYNVPMVDHPTNKENVLVQFPKRHHGLTVHDISALQHLNHWLIIKRNFTEHNPSCSIYFSPEEAEAVKQWLFDNQEYISGLSFFPRFEANYPYLPIYPIDEITYQENVEQFPKINWEEYPTFTAHDSMKDERERVVECAAGECVLVY